MSKNEMVNTVSKLQVVVVGKDGVAKIVAIDQLSKILATSGDKFQVLRKVNGENVFVDNFIVIKNGEDLELSFANGETLSLENFYSFNNVELTFESADSSVYTLSSSSSIGQELSNGTTLVYAQGEQNTLVALAKGNESLETALTNHLSVQNSELFAATDIPAEAPVAATAGGISTTTGILVALGAVAVGVAASGGSSGGGGSDSSGSSSSSGSTVSGQLVDSAVAGVAYYINGATEPSGYTDANGYFTYTAGDTVTFKVGDVTLKANYDTTHIPSDKKVTLQDLLGIERNKTTDATVVKMAQLLQTLDADGNADNGIQIVRNSEGSVIYTKDDDAGSTDDLDTNNDGVVSQAEYDNAVARFASGTDKILEDTATGVISSSTVLDAGDGIIVGGKTVKTEEQVKTHLQEQLEKIIKEEAGVTDISELKVGSLEALATAIIAGKKYIIATNTINLTDLTIPVSDGIITQAQADAINSYKGKLVINDNSDGYQILTVSLEQAKNMSFESGEHDSVEVVITNDDTDTVNKIDLTDIDLSDVDTIHFTTTESTTITLTLAQAMKINTHNSSSILNIEDTIENLAGITIGTNEELAISAASYVILKLTKDTDFSELDISNSSIDVIITGDYTAYITASMYSSASNDQLFFSYDGGESAVGSTVILKDSYINIINVIGSTNAAELDIILTGTPSIDNIQSTTTYVTTGEVSYGAIKDTASNLTDSENVSYFSSNPDVTISDESVKVAQVRAVDALTTGTLTYLLADTLVNLVANSTYLKGATGYIIVDDNGQEASGTLEDVTLVEALIIDGAGNINLTYTLATNYTLAELLDLEAIPATYTLANTDSDLGELTVAQAEIVLGASNANIYNYTLKDTAENIAKVTITSGESDAITSASSVTITDTALDASKISSTIESTQSVNTTLSFYIAPTSLTGKWSEIDSVINRATLLSDDNASFTITVTDSFTSTLSASTLISAANNMKLSYGLTDMIIKNPLTLTNIDTTAIESLTADDSIISLPSNINFMAGTESSLGSLTIQEYKTLDTLTTGSITANISDTLANIQAQYTANGTNGVLGTDLAISTTDTDKVSLTVEKYTQLNTIENLTITNGYIITDSVANLFEETAPKLIQNFGDADLSLPGSITLVISGTSQVIEFSNSDDLVTKVGELSGIESATYDSQTNSITITGANTGTTATLEISNVFLFATLNVTETADITFTALTEGQSVTVAGLILTATASMSASEVAAAFANSETNPTNGTFSGSLDGWTAGSASATTVTFTSTTLISNVENIEASVANIVDATSSYSYTYGLDMSDFDKDVFGQEIIAIIGGLEFHFEYDRDNGIWIDKNNAAGFDCGLEVNLDGDAALSTVTVTSTSSLSETPSVEGYFSFGFAVGTISTYENSYTLDMTGIDDGDTIEIINGDTTYTYTYNTSMSSWATFDNPSQDGLTVGTNFTDESNITITISSDSELTIDSVTGIMASSENLTVDTTDGSAQTNATLTLESEVSGDPVIDSTIGLEDDITITDSATASQVKELNDYTSGLITIESISTDTTTIDSLADLLGDLSGITGVTSLDIADNQTTNITLTAADLFEANDGTGNTRFTLDADTSDTVLLAGWAETTGSNTPTGYKAYSIEYNSNIYTIKVTEDTTVTTVTA